MPSLHHPQPQPASDPQPLGSQVYERLLRELLSIEIEPGARLSVDALSRRYGISPTPMREALGRLEAEGLVVRHHLRGYRATESLTEAEVQAMFDFRDQLEPFAAGRAATLRTEDQIDELRRLASQMKATARREEADLAYGDFAELDARLHALIAEMSGNALIQDSLSTMHAHMHYFRLRRDRMVALDALDEHAVIIEAIARRDRFVAEGAMRSHLVRSRGRLLGEQESP